MAASTMHFTEVLKTLFSQHITYDISGNKHAEILSTLKDMSQKLNSKLDITFPDRLDPQTEA